MRNKSYLFLAVLLVFTLSLTSCGLYERFLNLLGFDTHDYDSEPTIAVLDPNSETVLQLQKMTQILAIDSPYLTPFESFSDALHEYMDCVLNFLLTENFAKYNGNQALLQEADEIYPQLHITTVVPRRDVENIIYEYFGGNLKIKHKNTIYYTYLEKLNAYTSIGQALTNNLVVTVLSCEETQNTYRLQIQNTLEDITSPIYEIQFRKRDDGTCYITHIRTLS